MSEPEQPADPVTASSALGPETVAEVRPRHGLLIGAGQAHLEFLRRWDRRPISGVQLTLLTAYDRAIDRRALSRGVAAGELAAALPIPLVEWCRRRAVSLIVDRAVALDPLHRRVDCAHHGPVAYDFVSLNLGSVPAQEALWQSHRSVIGFKPCVTLIERFERRLLDWQVQQQAAGDDSALRLSVVGAGISGVEVACALALRLRSCGIPARISLLDGQPQFLPEAEASFRRRTRSILESLAIELQLGRRVVACDDEGVPALILDDGTNWPSDLTLWTAGRNAPQVVRRFGLPQSDRGLLKARSTLQSVAADDVWIVGGVSDISGLDRQHPVQLARQQGRLLYRNLSEWLQGHRPAPQNPLGTDRLCLDIGDGTVLLTTSWGTWRQRWLPWWERSCLQRWLRKLQRQAMTAAVRITADSAQEPK